MSKNQQISQISADSSSSRDQILQRLRDTKRPFPAAPAPPSDYRPVVPRVGSEPAALTQQFIAAAEALACVIHKPATEREAIVVLLELIGEDTAVSCWQPDHMPLPGLATALADNGIETTRPADSDVRVGITGASAALAATGSLVLASSSGQARSVSLLPPVHIAIIRQDQIMPDLEYWFSQHKQAGLDDMRQASNIVVISGPSRTADIALQMVMGMHGPRALHIILLP